MKKKPDPPKTETKPEPKPEPVYYIVEKKKPKKSTYSSPKEIEFKNKSR